MRARGDLEVSVTGQSYYLSQTEPGRLTTFAPASGTATKIGTALSQTTLNVQIMSGQTDGRTLVKRPPDPGPYSVVAYGSASIRDFQGRSNVSWQLAPTSTLPGTPISKNLVGGTDFPGQQPAEAARVALFPRGRTNTAEAGFDRLEKSVHLGRSLRDDRGPVERGLDRRRS